jgi:hypothetical protein
VPTQAFKDALKFFREKTQHNRPCLRFYLPLACIGNSRRKPKG